MKTKKIYKNKLGYAILYPTKTIEFTDKKGNFVDFKDFRRIKRSFKDIEIGLKNNEYKLFKTEKF